MIFTNLIDLKTGKPLEVPDPTPEQQKTLDWIGRVAKINGANARRIAIENGLVNRKEGGCYELI